METVVANLISQWGSFGILVICVLYIIWKQVQDFISSSKNINKEHKNITHDTDIIITKINTISNNLQSSVINVEQRLNNIDNRMDKLDGRIDKLDNMVKKQPTVIMNSFDAYNNKLNDLHNKKLLSQIELGPILHGILTKYLTSINCDHIVIGVFHNGTATLSGIPYCKFDIISEKFKPSPKDTDFAPLYKNVDILLHGKLPSIIMQNNYMHFDIKSNSKLDELDEIDDVLYRRLLGRGIKQLDLHILRDLHEIPIGFIGCIKYDESEMSGSELDKCVNEIQNIYNSQLEKIK